MCSIDCKLDEGPWIAYAGPSSHDVTENHATLPKTSSGMLRKQPGSSYYVLFVFMYGI